MLLRSTVSFAAAASLAVVTGLWLFQQSASADASVGIAVGRSGYYGQVNVGNYPSAAHSYYAAPVVVEERPIRPIYLSVPEYQAHDWDDYCHYYEACGRQVYLRIEEIHPYREFWHSPRWRHHKEEWHRNGEW